MRAFEPHAPDQFETVDTYTTKTREVETGGKIAAHPMHGHDVAREIAVEREREVGAPLEADESSSAGSSSAGGGTDDRWLDLCAGHGGKDVHGMGRKVSAMAAS